VGGHDHPQLAGQLHGGEQILVRQVERALVGQEHLEGRDAGAHDLAELVPHARLEPHHRHVKRVIHRGEALRLGAPQLERVPGLVRGTGADHLDQRRRAARQRRPAGGGVVVGCEGAHEGQVDVHVRVDEPGEDELAGRVHDLGAGRERLRVDRGLDAGDRFPGAVDVGGIVIGGRNDAAVLDQERHGD
jgi:hypothetical protein